MRLTPAQQTEIRFSTLRELLRQSGSHLLQRTLSLLLAQIYRLQACVVAELDCS
jgi:hypothetical protein